MTSKEVTGITQDASTTSSGDSTEAPRTEDPPGTSLTAADTDPKKIKMEDDTSDPCTSSELEESQWLYHAPSKIQLTVNDRNVITCGYRLNDKHINFALGILKAQFPTIEGLKLTILQSRFKFDSSKHIVQVLHVHGDHWITISNLRCDSSRIVVYDSVYSSIDTRVKDFFNSMFSADLQILTCKEMPKQTGVQIVVYMPLQLLQLQSCEIQSFFALITFAYEL